MSLAYSIARSGMTRIYNSALHTPPVLDMGEYFPQAPQFIQNWEAIRDEAKTLAGNLDQVPQFHEIMAEQYKLSGYGDREWRVFVLRAYGLDLEKNMARCPTLARIVRDNPNVKSATLSFLAPGKQIPTHTGPFRGITRFYMGLSVPKLENGEPGVTLTVDNQAYKLGDGQAMLWDDTYPHSVDNATDQWRIALLLDVYRVNMPSPLRALTNFIIGLAAANIRWRKVFPAEFA